MTLHHVDELTSLVREASPPCASLYVPLHRTPAEAVQLPIRLENMLKAAAQELASLGYDSRTTDAVLGEARALHKDSDTWPAPGDALAILASKAGTTIQRVPLELRELCIVADRLHVKPLLPLLTGNGRFYVLALSQNSVRLFEGSREGLRAMSGGDIPSSVREVVGFDVEQKALQFHSSGRPPTAGRRSGAIYHGHGAGNDDQKEEIVKFLRAVDDGIRGILRDRKGPVVLAAAEPISSMFRQISKLDDLAKDGPSGNFDHDEGPKLFEKAWPHVSARFDAAREKTAARAREALGTGLAVQRIEEVLVAAREGRVDAMLAAKDAFRWGRADGDIELHSERQPGDVDLIDLAAFECLSHGGTVHVVPADEVPGDDAVVVAVLRY